MEEQYGEMLFVLITAGTANSMDLNDWSDTM